MPKIYRRKYLRSVGIEEETNYYFFLYLRERIFFSAAEEMGSVLFNAKNSTNLLLIEQFRLIHAEYVVGESIFLTTVVWAATVLQQSK